MVRYEDHAVRFACCVYQISEILRHAGFARLIGEFKCSFKGSGNAREVVSLSLVSNLAGTAAAGDTESKSCKFLSLPSNSMQHAEATLARGSV
jgi:hypothetical protein